MPRLGHLPLAVLLTGFACTAIAATFAPEETTATAPAPADTRTVLEVRDGLVLLLVTPPPGNDDAQAVSGERELPAPGTGGDVSPAAEVGDAAHFQETLSGWVFASGYKRRGHGLVLVSDQNGVPVNDVRVYYTWSGCTDESSSALTTTHPTRGPGWADFLTRRSPACGRGGSANCDFILTGISLSPPPPIVYDAGQDVDTYGIVRCQPLG